MKPREVWLLLALFLAPGLALRPHTDQAQEIKHIHGEEVGEIERVKRDVNVETVEKDISSVFHLNDSHLHLMVHWAGQGSSIVFCLARDQEINEISTSRVFISTDYGTTFKDISGLFTLNGDTETNSTTKKLATINKFFHHPLNNCYYVFTDILHKHMFVTLDCGKTVATYKTQFSPRHLEFDEKLEGRFLVHDREDEKMELFVTKNFGETFSHAGDYIKSFYFDHREDSTLLYVSRMEPSGKLNVLSSSSFFERQIDTRVVFTGADQFEMKDGFLFAVTEQVKEGITDRQLHVARPGERFVIADFPAGQSFRDFHVAEVTPDDGLLVIVNHAGNLSSLYISDVVSEYEVQFSLALPRIMFYAKNTTWRSSWLEKMQENLDKVEANFADFYRVSGLRGVYLASQLADGVTEDSLRPPNLTTLISFNSGATWQPVQGPKTDHEGNPVLGCYQESDCSLHIAQQLSRKYPATRSIPVLTSEAAPGLLLASGNMGHSLGYKTSVFLSADAGLSWHQVLKGNYYYNVGDHGGVIVAVKYFKTEGDTNTLLYSIDEGLTWKSHQFYPTPIRIFGLITEPGENTTVFTMFGTQSSPSPTIDWIIVRVDLRSVFNRNCTDVDYKDWSPAAPGQGKESRCVLGRKEVYRRRSPKAKCYNGLDFTHTTRVEQCPCSHLDYQCDFGFIRDRQGDRDSHCIKDPLMEDHDPFAAPLSCSPGALFNQTKGYRRIAGDSCIAGLDTRYEPELRTCPLDLAEPRTFLLVAQRKRIVRLDLSAPNSTIEPLPLIGMRNVIAMDFDISTDCVFWGDIDQDKIMKQCLNDSSPPQVLAESRLSSVEGMAYDHISKILYFVDGTQKKIELLKVDKKHGATHLRKTILHQAELGESSKPRGIAVHPSQGYIFYSDWADKGACIGRARLDGSHHKLIIDTVGQNKNRRLLGWPNGLTVDVWANRIYFVDAQKDFLASANLDGGDFKKIVSGRAETAHPFAVAVFQKKGLVLWNDWTRKAIYQADKNSGKGILMLEGNVEGAMDMKIYSPGVLAEKNACSENDCSHLCMAMPPNTGVAYICLCPDGMKVDGPNGKQCKCPNGDLPTDDRCTTTNGQCAQDQWKCGNGLCIAESWLCDGVSDCGDNTDENNEQCQEKCKDSQFQCANGKCVPGYWKCDFDDDCGDESDEHDCPETTCNEQEFRCENGQCINAKWECDLEKDCQDGSDESNCTASTAQCNTGPDGTQLQCKTGGACLPMAWHCDGDQDCPDNSDEEDCDEVKSCQDWQFKCDNGHCIFQTWRCDGDADCADESDERDCTVAPGNRTNPPQPTFPRGVCNEWMFKCSNEQCVPFWWKCDGVRDCSDGSDEEQCGHDDIGDSDEDTETPPGHPEVVGCPEHKFQCSDGACIWAAWVCDTEADCAHGEDEEASLCSARQVCGAGKFMCELSGTCIDIAAVCDGNRDCDDGTDEKRCNADPFDPPPEIACDGETSFLCDLGETCVQWAGKCDGHRDCVDGSDEEMCELWMDERKVEGLEVEEDRSTADSLTVLWWVPDLPSTSELRFKYGLSIGDHGRWTNVSDWEENKELEHVFTGLQPGTEYDLRVFVKNGTDGQEFLHAPVAKGRTLDGVPDAPRQPSMIQKGGSVELSWQAPLDPQGSLIKYIVRVLKGGDRVKEVEVGAAASSVSLAWLEQDTVYQAEVMAVNLEHRSAPSPRIDMVLKAGQGSVSAIDVTNTTATLSWEVDTDSKDSLYNVTFSSSNPLANHAPGGSRKVKGSSLTLHGLSPGEKYNVEVCKVQGSGHTAPSSTSFTTLGPRLPIPKLITAEATSPTEVKMTWMVKGSQKDNYSYGVWWGVNMEELMSKGPRMRADTSPATASKLLPCTKYLFAVAVLGLRQAGSGPIGRMSTPKTVTTQPSPLAPPRELKAEGFTLSWKQPCDLTLSSEPLPSLVYQVVLKDSRTGKNVTRTLESSNKLTNSFEFPNLQPGSRWEATVRVVTTESSIPSAPVLLLGPPLAPPTAVYAHTAEEGYSVSWAPSSKAKSYEVVLSPDPNFENKTCEVRLPAREAPLNLRPSNLFNSSLPAACRHKAFSVGVVAIAEGGISAYSRAGQTILPVSLLPPPGTITIDESSAVGTVVGVLIVMCLLGAGIGYFAYSNRRMRTRFREFTAGHYSSATGTATLIDDDDESPIIRGFSDDEPLVM